MINAICGIKTSVCTGNCNSCVNSPLLGKTAVKEMEHSISAYNKGYTDGQKETAKEIYKALLGTEHIKELEQKEDCEWWVSRWRIEDLNRVFKGFGVEVEE